MYVCVCVCVPSFTPTSLCYSDDGERLAVGFACGSVAILDADTLDELHPPTAPPPTPAAHGGGGQGKRPSSPGKRAKSPGKKGRGGGDKKPVKEKEDREGRREAVGQIVYLEGGEALAVQVGTTCVCGRERGERGGDEALVVCEFLDTHTCTHARTRAHTHIHT